MISKSSFSIGIVIIFFQMCYYFCKDNNIIGEKIDSKMVDFIKNDIIIEDSEIVGEIWNIDIEDINFENMEDSKKYLSKGDKCINQPLECESGLICEKEKWGSCLKICNDYKDCNPLQCYNLKSCQEIENLKVCVPHGCFNDTKGDQFFIPSIQPICPMWGADISNELGILKEQKLQAAGWKKFDDNTLILLGFECHNTNPKDSIQILTHVVLVEIENKITNQSHLLIDGEKVKIGIENYTEPLKSECIYKVKSVTGSIKINSINESHIEGIFEFEADMMMAGQCGGKSAGKLSYKNGWFKAKNLPADSGNFPPPPDSIWWKE